ncbi:MAG: phosphatidylinositol-specific phospholipase C domain-containing protein, partial [Candidatus Sericytochromatia bacterium]
GLMLSAVCLFSQAAAERSPAPAIGPAFSWRALATEQELARDLPWRQVQLIGGHNAYNERGDRVWQNQLWSIGTQLDHGVRVIELDLHYQAGPAGDWTVRACHGITAQDCVFNNAGSRDFREVLNEIRAWSDRHPQQVLIIELENHISRAKDVLGPLLAAFGDLIYQAEERPSDWLEETPRRILARGRRIIVADFGPLRYDGTLIWDENELFSNLTSKDFGPGCSVRGQPMAGGHWGFYDDKTLRISGLPPIDEHNFQAYLACDVRYLKLDRLNEAILAAAQFSWQSDAVPTGLVCAAMGPGGYRWRDGACTETALFACRGPDPRSWRLTTGAGPWAEGESACRREFGPDFHFDVPRSYRQNLDLWEAITNNYAGAPIWLNYRLTTLTITDPRP